MMGACVKCGEHGYVMPLHDERGGPLFCFMCAGAWHAEYGPRRRARRVVIKALRAYEAAGGHVFGKDFDELKLAASGFSAFSGFEANTDFSDLTSELLAATIALTHPDKHPPERKAEANRVTQELHALKPFVFPAPEPEPPKPRDASFKEHAIDLNEPSPPAYPCEDCRDAIPMHYCNPCKAQWEKEQLKEREREEKERKRKNACARARYKASKRFRDLHAKPTVCVTCGNAFKPKRRDAKYCSAACRQRAYVKRDGKLKTARAGVHRRRDQVCLHGQSRQRLHHRRFVRPGLFGIEVGGAKTSRRRHRDRQKGVRARRRELGLDAIREPRRDAGVLESH
jgi:hypothetical protein